MRQIYSSPNQRKKGDLPVQTLEKMQSSEEARKREYSWAVLHRKKSLVKGRFSKI
jgi:hypothetical protein